MNPAVFRPASASRWRCSIGRRTRACTPLMKARPGGKVYLSSSVTLSRALRMASGSGAFMGEGLRGGRRLGRARGTRRRKWRRGAPQCRESNRGCLRFLCQNRLRRPRICRRALPMPLLPRLLRVADCCCRPCSRRGSGRPSGRCRQRDLLIELREADAAAGATDGGWTARSADASAARERPTQKLRVLNGASASGQPRRDAPGAGMADGARRAPAGRRPRRRNGSAPARA